MSDRIFDKLQTVQNNLAPDAPRFPSSCLRRSFLRLHVERRDDSRQQSWLIWSGTTTYRFVSSRNFGVINTDHKSKHRKHHHQSAATVKLLSSFGPSVFQLFSLEFVASWSLFHSFVKYRPEKSCKMAGVRRGWSCTAPRDALLPRIHPATLCTNWKIL
jgi:hypothetical protein